MFPNATVSSRSSSSRSGNSYTRNSSLPSLRMPNPLFPKTSFNPLFRQSDAFTSFDASNFIFQDNKKNSKTKPPSLRRFNSHDSRASFSEVLVETDYSVSESLKNNSNSKTSQTSPDSTEERSRHQDFEARDFLERYSLPRVVRVEKGEPLLLYRCFDSFTKVEAKGITGRKGKEKVDSNSLYFPEGYSGWFSLTNEKGEKSAVVHSSLLQLVREQVCSFISIQSFTAYAASNQDSSDNIPGKTQYLKTQIRGGQVFQLRAVFQHREGSKHSDTRASRVSRSTKDRDLANRYAQLISQNNQELYVPLTTKGEFYETYSSIKARLCFPGLIDKTGPLALDRDCLYKLTHLLRRIALPIKVKLINGPLPNEVPKDFTDTFVLEKKFQEPLMVTCTLPPPSDHTKHEINCINLNSKVKINKCSLGFDSENRLFKSQRVQAALAFCHKNVENWYREVRLVPNMQIQNNVQNKFTTCKECNRNNLKCSENCRNMSKTDSLEYSDSNKQIITKQVLDKFPKSKKWYRHFKILKVGNENNANEQYSDIRDPMEGIEKVKSIERYKDMSKLIEDKFGKKSYNPVKKSASFMYSSKRIDLEETSNDNNNPALLKCQSLDTQIYTNEDENRHMELFKRNLHRRISNASDNFSNSEFQMCILENDGGLVDTKSKMHLISAQGESLKELRSSNLYVTKIDFDEIKPADEFLKLKKTKPDLIPTLPKTETCNKSYITERLCSEFHVKTKIQKKTNGKQNFLNDLTSIRITDYMKENKSGYSIFDNRLPYTDNLSNYPKRDMNIKSVVVQVHEESLPKSKKGTTITDDIPYSNVVDEVNQSSSERKSPDENIYAEICEENSCNCDSMQKCKCSRTKTNKLNYYYVRLGSNGDSVIQSDSDEAIYNTLR